MTEYDVLLFCNPIDNPTRDDYQDTRPSAGFNTTLVFMWYFQRFLMFHIDAFIQNVLV